jgi:hypothetical protein
MHHSIAQFKTKGKSGIPTGEKYFHSGKAVQKFIFAG